MKLIGFLLIGCLLFLSTGFAHGSEMSYLYFEDDKNSESYKISYEVVFDGGIEQGDIFASELYYNGNFEKEICSKIIEFESDTIFRKITCEIPKLGEGEYIIKTSLKRGENIIHQIITKEYFYEQGRVGMEYIEDPDSETTTIVLNLNLEETYNLTGQELVHEIPKEVIEKITPENKNLLRSSHDFRIIKEDPIIAWDLESIDDEKIEYKVKGNIDPEIKEDFKIKIQEKSKETKTLELFIMGAILLIIILVLKPLFKKKE